MSEPLVRLSQVRRVFEHGTVVALDHIDLEIPRGSTKTDWEAELAVVISKAGRYIEEADWEDHVAGYACMNDVSERAFQTESTGQWVKGKSLDEAAEIKNTHIAEELALPPVKIHCSVLAEDAIKAAIQDYQGKSADAPQAAEA